MRRGLVAAALVCATVSPAAAQAPAQSFPRGEVVEEVRSQAFPDQRYALYLPSTFDPAVPAPVLFVMDPRRRALVPMALFQPAAERFGYIIVSSHNTISDESMEPNLRALQAMWTDMHDWFRVDDRRVYLAGFSGTARTAWLLARHLSGTFTGVIGAAAGSHPDYPPTPDFKFAYYATVGTVDYNYYELQRLEERLAALGLRHRVEQFEGPHGWMPAPLAMQAIEWMELQAMRAGLRPVEAELVDSWWARDEAAAQVWLDAGRPLEASWRYAAMARDYAGLRPLGDAVEKAASLGASLPAKQELERRQRAARQYALWTKTAMSTITEAFMPGTEAPALAVEHLARELEVGRLRKAAGSADADEAREAQRRLNTIEVQLGFYLPREALARAEYVRATYYLDVAVQMDEHSPVSWYLTAVARARLREPREAAAALARALDCGYRNVAEFDAESAFRNVAKDPAFAAAAERLRAVANDR
jgi:dienelactone hydrolase